MHALSKHWVVTLLMGGLTLSFVVWGMGLNQFDLGGSTQVASIGSTEISGAEFQRTYRNFVRNQSQRTGSEITPDMAEKMGLPQVALQQMVGRTAVQNEAARLGLITSDGAVAQNVRAMAPFRGTLGTFDRPTFMQAIARADYTEEQFLNEIRQEMTVDQLTQAVEANFVLPTTYAQAIAQYLGEKRAAEYIVLTPAMAGDVAAPSDAVLSAYVKAQAARYSTPEYREADYAAITPADVMGSVTVTDAQIQQQYDASKSTYIIPEKRDVQQMDFKTLAEAQAARAKIGSGTSFDALAAERGLKPEQISLGTLTQEELPDAERAKAIFALPLNDVSQPIKTGFGGFVLARATKITPGSTKTLADVKEEIRKTLTSQLADSKLVDVVNTYTDARSAGDDFTTAAKKAGMKVSRLNAVDASGLKPDGSAADVPADPEFLPALFKADVGDDVDPFVTKLGAYYTIHVNGETPPKLKPLEQVRAQALTDYTNDQRAKLLATKAQTLAAQARKDKSLDTIAKQLNVSVLHSPALARDTTDANFSAQTVARLFAAPPGGVDVGPQGQTGNYMIARVSGIAHPAMNPRDPAFQAGVVRFSQTVAQDFSIDLSNAARARQGVKVNQKLVTSITGASQ
ncbi:MAG TPA: SurA N-terminal domain-containing protein [Rhizomicrobium sp.]|nr:SurA N-terminal domain-containing protein [Rhizomicrobium sp.]